MSDFDILCSLTSSSKAEHSEPFRHYHQHNQKQAEKVREIKKNQKKNIRNVNSNVFKFIGIIIIIIPSKKIIDG